MPATRRSARLSSQESSPAQPKESPKAVAGSKRKADVGSSPVAKKGRKNAPKEQKSIEETMDIDKEQPKKTQVSNQDEAQHNEQTAPQIEDKAQEANGKRDEPKPTADHSTGENGEKQEEQPQSDASVPATNGDGRSEEEPQTKAQSDPKPEASDALQVDSEATKENKEQIKSDEKPTANGSSAALVKEDAHKSEVPSSILEKGLIYFFYRGRVGIEDPSNPTDIARSYMVLRALPHDAGLGGGAVTSSKASCRLLALPKKVLPVSGKDKFMSFVERSHASFSELKKDFLPASDYETQTAGARHTPAATPLAEGVYAITTTGRESHLAYMLTIPSEISEVQKDMGLREQGSFVVSVRNPQYDAPAYAQLPQKAEYSEEIQEKFRALRWAPLEPAHLDYENTQFLLIGEGADGFDNAMKPQEGDENKADPKEEVEKLEGEDEIRIKHLKGDDAIFADLGVSKKDYHNIPSTWND